MRKVVYATALVAVCVCSSVITLYAARRGSISGNEIKNLSSTTATRTFNVAEFSKIDVSRVDVELIPATATGQLTLTAPDNVIDLIKVSSSGGKLKICLDPEYTYNKGSLKAKVKVSAPSVSKIDASLAANVTVTGAMLVDGNADYEVSTAGTITFGDLKVAATLNVTSSTAGSVKIGSLTGVKCDFEAATAGSVSVNKLDCTFIECESATASSISIGEGSATRCDFEASTAASIDAGNLKVGAGKAEASTGGKVICRVEQLSSEASTGGKVKNNSSR